MSEEKTQQKCAVCSAYLFEDDETVYCPECGAPHHRECYNALGHCGLSHLHGTEQSYDKTSKNQEQQVAASDSDRLNSVFKDSDNDDNGDIKCGMCGETYDSQERNCPNCGAPNMSRFGQTVTFDYLGGIPADMDLGDGVTADEAKRFVLSNTHRYIPKFAAFTAGVRTSWNWMAFLFPCAWYLSRKMYKNGILVGLLTIAFSMLTVPFSNALNYVDLSGAQDYMQMGQLVYENIPQIGVAVTVAAVIGVLLGIALRVFAAITGDYTYKNHMVETVKKMKNESLDIDEDYRRLGGVSLIGMFIGVFAVQNLPSIIAMFL